MKNKPQRIRMVALVIAATSLMVYAGADEPYTADWLQANVAKVKGQRVSVAIERASPGKPQGDWFDFYCFTPAGAIHVLVPVELAPAFLERYGQRAEPESPHVLSAVVQVMGSGEPYLRVSAATSKTRIWTSSDGRRIEADYVWSDDTTVTIRRLSDGKTYQVKLTDLSLADRAYVRERRP